MYNKDCSILNKEIDISSLLRIGVEAEMNTLTFYKKIASLIGPDNPAYELFQHIIEEEMVHVGEFEEMAERYNEKYREKINEGRILSSNL